MFTVGDRVRLAQPFGVDGREPIGIVTGFVTPQFAAQLDVPDDVLVRWDSGLELQHAPARLVAAPGEA